MPIELIPIVTAFLKRFCNRKKDNKADHLKQVVYLERQQEEEPESFNTGLEGEGLLRFTRK